MSSKITEFDNIIHTDMWRIMKQISINKKSTEDAFDTLWSQYYKYHYIDNMLHIDAMNTILLNLRYNLSKTEQIFGSNKTKAINLAIDINTELLLNKNNVATLLNQFNQSVKQ